MPEIICEGYMKKVINSNNAPKAIGPYSQAVEDGGFIFTSGVLPVDPVTGEIYNGDVQVQTELILNNLENIKTRCQNHRVYDRFNQVCGNERDLCVFL